MATLKPINIFVDVDDTFIRSFGSKRIPIPATIEHLKNLKKKGANLYCWSSGGADYAQKSAAEFSIADIFTAFLPKPQVMIDDQNINNWKRLIQVHPFSCTQKTLEDYQMELKGQ
jgi:predicted HAD superfamily phosphohydrolase YqeG